MKDNKPIQTYTNREAAELDRSLLASCGIDSRIISHTAGGWLPLMMVGQDGTLQLWVAPENREEARRILETPPEAPK